MNICTYMQGHYTVDTRCEYTTAASGYFDSTVIEASGANVRCKCAVTRLYITNGLAQDHVELEPAYTGTCTLVITNCPLTVNIP